MITWIGQELGVRSRRFVGRCCAIERRRPTPPHRNMGRRGSETGGCLRASRGRTRSQSPSSNRLRLQSSRDDLGRSRGGRTRIPATGPEHVSHTRGGGGVNAVGCNRADPLFHPRNGRMTQGNQSLENSERFSSGAISRESRLSILLLFSAVRHLVCVARPSGPTAAGPNRSPRPVFRARIESQCGGGSRRPFS